MILLKFNNLRLEKKNPHAKQHADSLQIIIQFFYYRTNSNVEIFPLITHNSSVLIDFYTAKRS